MNNEKGFIQVLLILGIAVVVGIIGYIILTNGRSSQVAAPVPSPYQAQYNQGAASANQIQSSNDLNTASQNLDSANTAQIDAQLKALDSASAGF